MKYIFFLPLILIVGTAKFLITLFDPKWHERWVRVSPGKYQHFNLGTQPTIVPHSCHIKVQSGNVIAIQHGDGYVHHLHFQKPEHVWRWRRSVSFHDEGASAQPPADTARSAFQYLLCPIYTHMAECELDRLSPHRVFEHERLSASNVLEVMIIRLMLNPFVASLRAVVSFLSPTWSRPESRLITHFTVDQRYCSDVDASVQTSATPEEVLHGIRRLGAAQAFKRICAQNVDGKPGFVITFDADLFMKEEVIGLMNAL